MSWPLAVEDMVLGGRHGPAVARLGSCSEPFHQVRQHSHQIVHFLFGVLFAQRDAEAAPGNFRRLPQGQQHV